MGEFRSDVVERDFFTDAAILQDPVPYYVALRERGPIWREPHHDVVVLSGIEEIIGVYADHADFSAIVAALGPLVPLSRPEPGESWAEMIERCRSEIPMGNEITSIDPPLHTHHRAMASKLFTPNRLQENEEFMWKLSEELLDELGSATVTWIIRWEDMVERNQVMREAFRTPAWKEIMKHNPGVDHYHRTEARFAEQPASAGNPRQHPTVGGRRWSTTVRFR